MKRLLLAMLLLCSAGCAQQSAKPFTLQQILSAPFASELVAAPEGARFAWVENAEGVRNIWVGGPNETAHAITHYSEDDGQEISGLVWSPNGHLLAYARGGEEGADGKPANPAELQEPPSVEIWTVHSDGADRPVRNAQGHLPMWIADSSGVLFVRDGKIFGAYSEAGVGSPGGTQLVFDRGDASQMTLSPDGTELAYVSTRKSNGREHSFIGVFDLQARALKFIAPGTGVDSAPAWSPHGRQLAWLRAPFTTVAEFVADKTSPNPWQLMVADVATGKARVAFEPEANKLGSVLPHMATDEPKVWWALGGKELIFASEADGWVHLYAGDASATRGKAQLLTPGEYEVEDPTPNADGTAMIFASNQWRKDDYDNVERRHVWRVALNAAAPPEALSSGGGIETHPAIAADKLVALVSDGRVPMHVAEILKDQTILPLHSGGVPSSYPIKGLVTPEHVVFSSKLSLSKATMVQIHGQLFLPPGMREQPQIPFGNDNQRSTGEKQALRGAVLAQNDNGLSTKHPAILFFHGGPRRQMLLGYPTMEYYSNAYAMNEYLASRGFIVLSVNYHCGIGYGIDFRECERGGAAGASEYADVLAAWQYLKSRGDVDMKRVGIWGGSYGGYLTALALARNSDLFAAGVDIHGVHEWSVEDNASDWLRGTDAEKAKIAAVAHASSPMADVSKWKSPVLLIHGDDDPDVAYAQTPLLAEALRARGVPVEEMIFPDEVHGFLLHKDWLAAYERAAEFFERELKPAS